MDLAEHSCFTNWGDFKSTQSQQIKSNVGFWWKGKTGAVRTLGKTSKTEKRTNKLNPQTLKFVGRVRLSAKSNKNDYEAIQGEWLVRATNY